MEDAQRQVRWIVLAQAGDRQALDSLFQFAQPKLFPYIRSLTGSESLAEDVLQEVFLLVYRKLGFLEDPVLFLPWCYRIAAREALRRLKKERKRGEVEFDPTIDVSYQDGAFDRPSAEEARALVERAPPACRAVLALHYLQEMSLEETAGILGIPLGTAKSRLAYGLQTLRKLNES